MTEKKSQSLVLFDGSCGLCCGSIRFIMGRDRARKFEYAPLGTKAAASTLERHGMPKDDGTLVLEDNGKAYTHSTAVLRIFRKLDGPWPLLYSFILVPRPVRDAAYNLVARNRKRLFGSECSLPDSPQIVEN